MIDEGYIRKIQTLVLFYLRPDFEAVFIHCLDEQMPRILKDTFTDWPPAESGRVFFVYVSNQPSSFISKRISIGLAPMKFTQLTVN